MIEFIFCSGLFYALYRLLVEGRTSMRASRAYLVGSVILSVIIPLLELPLYPAETIFYELPVITLDEPTTVAEVEPQAAQTTVDVWRVLPSVVWVLYGIVVALNFGRVALRLRMIRRLRRESQLTFYEAYTLAESVRIKEPFSFWRTIFLNRDYEGREREQIIVHELSHVRHLHTAERMALEVMRCVFWFNPFVWVTASALVEVQEWEADRDVINEGYDVYEYRLLIFRQLFGCKADVACGLNSQTSKKRFLMMTDFRKGKLSFVRFGAVVPLVAVMVLAFGAKSAEAEVEVVQSELQTPEEKNAEVYLAADGKIFYNGEQMTIDELRSSLEKLRAEKGAQAVLDIRTDAATKMGAIENVKLAARQSKVLRIRYVAPDKEIDKILPPPEGDPNIPYDVEISENLKQKTVDFKNLRVAKNNLLMIDMNAAGKILTTRPDGKLGLVELAEVKDIVKQFIDNSESVNNSRKVKNPHYSSFTWQTIKRSADGEVHYPVSDGVISIQTTRDTSAENYLALQAAIVEAYAELREELSQRIFSKPFASLEGYDREYVLQAIPIKVSEADPRLPSGASK
ncbi:MAG: biopolymer transporter ExbD [Alistipes sp.]|nr:biopolymer transporter ExbD [Alistipes sp.]